MEAELIEPWLFLADFPPAAERYAAVLAACLDGDPGDPSRRVANTTDRVKINYPKGDRTCVS